MKKLKKKINQRRKEGESTRAAARRLAADKDAGEGHQAATQWLQNKKPVKKNAPVKTKPSPAPAPTNNARKR